MHDLIRVTLLTWSRVYAVSVGSGKPSPLTVGSPCAAGPDLAGVMTSTGGMWLKVWLPV